MIQPLTGVAGGNRLFMTGTGFGLNTASVDLLHVNSGNLLCRNAEILEYGQFSCDTIQQDIDPTDTMAIVIDGVQVDCQENNALCIFDARIANSPVLTEVNIIDKVTLQMIGSGFSGMSGLDAIAILADHQSSTTTPPDYISDTEIWVTFDKGVPRFSVDQTIYLAF